MKKIDIIASIWGEYYVGLFLDYCLSSLLSQNNIPALQGRGRLVLVTTEQDMGRIAEHPAFKLANQFIECAAVKFDMPNCDPFGQRYDLLASCNRAGIDRSMQDGHASAVLGADALYSDGYCKKLIEWLDSGKRLVLGIGMRGALESMKPQLESNRRNGILQVAPRDLVAFGLTHMHPIHQSAIWDAPYFTRMPYTLLFPVFGQGYVARSFVFHPYLIDPHEQMMGHKSNVDYDMAKFYGEFETHYVTDTDEAVCLEIATIQHFWPMGTPYRASPDVIARWTSDQVCTEQWRNINVPVFVHKDDLDMARWTPVIAKSDEVVKQIEKAAGR